MLGRAQDPKNYEELPEHIGKGMFRVKYDGDVVKELTDYEGAKHEIEKIISGTQFNVVDWVFESSDYGGLIDPGGDEEYVAPAFYLHPVLNSADDPEHFVHADMDIWAVLLVAEHAR